jgi:hypothetical protein
LRWQRELATGFANGIFPECASDPVLARLEAQAQEIGAHTERTAHLRAELERARAQLSGRAEAIAPEAPPETQNAPQAEWPEGRPWWKRLLWG